jgi:transcriptional regulator with XRE-family HTH domain
MLIGWSQRELAGRARTSQPRVSRFESGAVDNLDVVVLARVLAALGLRGQITFQDLHLDDPASPARSGACRAPLASRPLPAATRLARRDRGPDRRIVAARLDRPSRLAPADGSGLMCEVKGDLPDIGGLQRQVRFYASAANGRCGRSAGGRRESPPWW